MQVLCYTQLVRSCYTYNHLIHWVSIAAVVSSRQSLEQKAASEEEEEGVQGLGGTGEDGVGAGAESGKEEGQEQNREKGAGGREQN